MLTSRGKHPNTKFLVSLTCNCFHHHVGHFWNFFINRDTKHLRCNPVQGSTERETDSEKKGPRMDCNHLSCYFLSDRKRRAPLARQAIQAPARTSGSADVPGSWNPMMRLLFCTYHKKAEDNFSSWNEIILHWKSTGYLRMKMWEEPAAPCPHCPHFRLCPRPEAHQSPSQRSSGMCHFCLNLWDFWSRGDSTHEILPVLTTCLTNTLTSV